MKHLLGVFRVVSYGCGNKNPFLIFFPNLPTPSIPPSSWPLAPTKQKSAWELAVGHLDFLPRRGFPSASPWPAWPGKRALIPSPPTPRSLPPARRSNPLSMASSDPPARYIPSLLLWLITSILCGTCLRNQASIGLSCQRRLLRLCEANKGFYVKAGQFVSSLRQVPKECSSSLSSLQDQAIPCHFKGIKEVIVKNLGKDLSEGFIAFDEQPMAAASIAQVHHGVLKDNQKVAIKVQHPGLEQRMMIDITTMDIFSKFVSKIFPDYMFERLVSEFEGAMSLELDFIQEANNSERAARNFKKSSIIKIPHVYWDLTTRQALTMQFCSGHKIDDLNFQKDSGINPKKQISSWDTNVKCWEETSETIIALS